MTEALLSLLALLYYGFIISLILLFYYICIPEYKVGVAMGVEGKDD